MASVFLWTPTVYSWWLTGVLIEGQTNVCQPDGRAERLALLQQLANPSYSDLAPTFQLSNDKSRSPDRAQR